MAEASVILLVLAHNEARRIGACLASLPLALPGLEAHVVVNGSRDGTAEIARRFAATHGNLIVHDWPEAGKARSWNRFLFGEVDRFAPVHVFVDGDAELAPGAVEALIAALDDDPHANATAGVPRNGRNAAHYRERLIREHGLFGDLYALRGGFLERMKAQGIRLPLDLIGDDGLIGAIAKTDLGPEYCWDEARVRPCPDAGFLCEPIAPYSPASLRLHYRRLVNYSVRHFQNRIVSAIMAETGPVGLPERLALLYPAWLPRFAPRPRAWWFDRLALRRMARAAG